MRQIKLFDTTLRDGEQAPGCTMNTKEKLEIARQLERLGVDIIEPGFPVSSPEDFQSVSQIAAMVKDSAVVGFARSVEKDIDIAWQAVKAAAQPLLHVFIATSDLHLQYKLQMSREELLERVRLAVAYAKKYCARVQFSAEDACRTDRDFLVQVFGVAAKAGATVVNIPDTVGYITPPEMGELVRFVRERLDASLDIAVHCHNDLGMAVANSLAAVRAGASQVECTVNGIGERAGNAALEEIVMALRTRGELFGASTGVHTKEIYRTSRLVATVTGLGVPANKAIVGANAFAHESGIHQHGILKNRATYEIMSPEDIGLYQNRMVLGKHSGKHAFVERLGEIGYSLPEEELEQAFEKFKLLAQQKKAVTDRDIEAIVGPVGVAVREVYRLHSFVVNSGTIISATAVVKLLTDEGELEQVARGDGPINAAFRAVDAIVPVDCQLENYSIQAVTEGQDALGEVVVKIRSGGRLITGRGLSTDIIEASIKAYLNAINKALAKG